MSRDEAILNFIFNPNANQRPILKPDFVELSHTSMKIDEELFNKLKELDKVGIQLAEEEKYDEALEKFTEAIQLYEKYGSAYNNRAQVYRLKKDEEKALEDLNFAIKYSDGVDYLTLRQAYTQRGMIYVLKGDEEKGRLDFEIAASLGSELAKKEAQKLNPYAQLCNAMVSQLMKEQFAPQQQQQQQQQQQNQQQDQQQ